MFRRLIIWAIRPSVEAIIADSRKVDTDVLAADAALPVNVREYLETWAEGITRNGSRHGRVAISAAEKAEFAEWADARLARIADRQPGDVR